MNTTLLRSKMVLNEDTVETLGEFLGLSRTRTQVKINAKDGAQFTQSEIRQIKERYNLTAEEIDDIFFTD